MFFTYFKGQMIQNFIIYYMCTYIYNLQYIKYPILTLSSKYLEKDDFYEKITRNKTFKKLRAL